MNNIPMANRLHIAFFGKTNVGKSSVVNALTGQDLSIVSDIKGTTTDPVMKTMELLPLGPVVIIDTPGLNDVGELGQLRIKKTYQVLAKTDVAVVVIDVTDGITKEDEDIINRIKEYKIPLVIAFNKVDELKMDSESNVNENLLKRYKDMVEDTCANNIKYIAVSAKTKQGINDLKETIGSFNIE